MAAIRADQEAQGRHLQVQRASLVSIISDLGSLRLMTKDTEVEPSHPGTPDPDAVTSEADVSRSPPAVVAANGESDREEGEEAEEGEAEEVERRQEDGQSSDDVPLSIALNSRARTTLPSRNSAPVTECLTRSHFNPTGSAPPSIVIHDTLSNSDDDIEMGELAEEREPIRGKMKLRREELEEGEASDESSELSEWLCCTSKVIKSLAHTIGPSKCDCASARMASIVSFAAGRWSPCCVAGSYSPAYLDEKWFRTSLRALTRAAKSAAI